MRHLAHTRYEIPMNLGRMKTVVISTNAHGHGNLYLKESHWSHLIIHLFHFSVVIIR